MSEDKNRVRFARYFLAPFSRLWLHTAMVKARLVFAGLCLFFTLHLQAFEWGTATDNGRDYVTLQSFCAFYGFGYQIPAGNDYFTSRSTQHSIRLKVGTADLYLDGVHYVMSFPVESEGRDWLVSRMDVIKLFEPILRPTEISERHSIRGVVIDAGHGGSDNGAVSARGGMEKTYTLDTAYRLEAILRDAGLKTVLTRRNDVFVDLYERAHIASLYPDYAFVSIHFNSATPEARGLETYCLSPRGAASTSSRYLTRSDIQKLPGNDYDAPNILLASTIHSEIIRLNPGDITADRGVKRARFVVIKQNVLPAVLVEGGFVSNRMEAARVNQPSYRQSLAEAIARGLIRFVNVMGNRRMSMPSAPPPESAPVAPRAYAPSGLASESPRAYPVAGVVQASPAGAKSAGSTNLGKKSKKKKLVSAKSKKTHAAALTSTNPPAAKVDPDGSAHPPLNLSEPATPTPSPEADKAPPEPDEPPTVNIYSTTPEKSPGGTGAGRSTNAAPNEP
jgi:N-acetylmuramoyl-L-alanine amidase